ncbi:pyridine nucleotide-disulfide oxidoreductase [Thermoclostridium stercorarium subsp. leptospartum DSM 9219]|uniref:NADH:ubiquinone reductase (non-electrogenic) n=2 Tax=Thermoclostridium stercorarium TaxID=1510 RepID=A0A1B1YNP7_THEST|nr:FAD-dependent oxidoreductase [Thermoclostridium stercorarium]ANX02410.1 pyridine nucleotide-disulfide oxidoreductase [Thermoclostridium stercorarium subsp. leptospartum DSM 9219]
MSYRVVVLGAGYAGIEAAMTLHKKKKKTDNIEIILIDKNPYHTFLTELHEVAGNRVDAEAVTYPLNKIFRYTDVRVIQDEIVSYDFENNKIFSEKREYPYDYLIIAAGSNPNYYGIPGMKENAFPLWSYEDALRIREHIEDCFIKASQETDPELRRKLLTIVVGGGGFTGVEAVGEIAIWVKALCREYGINRTEVRLYLVEALPDILRTMKEKNRIKATKYLKNRLKVEVLTNTTITKLEDDKLYFGDGSSILTSTVIWTAGVKACDMTNKMNLPKGHACRIEVDEYTQVKGFDNVYAVGDIALFIHEGQALPAMVETALQTGKAAAMNILRSIRGEEKKKLEPKYHGMMVSVGYYFAVAEIMGVSLNRLFAVIMKHLVNMHYYFGIGGFELVFRYLKHEFLYKRQHKPALEAFITKKTMLVWLVPLRLYIGYYWLMEGLKKAWDGWFVVEMLAGRATDAEATASLTEEGRKVFRIVSEHTPQWYEWIVDHVILPRPMLFQYLIVLTEIGLGLAFITGTFTILAAIVGIGLNINFLLSTGMYPETYWLIPAQIAMFQDAGKSFGVDYYLIPYLTRQWRYFVRNRKIKLNLFRE